MFSVTIFLVAVAGFPSLVWSAGDLSHSGAPLAQPDECINRDCEIRLGAFEYVGPYASFLTRAYNGDLPGPTIRVTAGDSFTITVINELSNDANLAGEMNTFHEPNTTNLHTHGLHISSLAPGDDVFTTVHPLSTNVYSYELPPDHMGGTFWYHPHYHGSTQIQSGGGAAGFLIVEDDPDEVPPRIAELPDLLIFMMHIKLSTLNENQDLFNDVFFQAVAGEESTEPPDEIFLVNGQTNPVISVVANKWYRWRLAFSSIHAWIEFYFTNPSCEMQLLAKDGVYLHEAPRFVPDLPLYPGARSDVAIRCDGSEPVVNFHGIVSFNDVRGVQIDQTWNDTVFTVEVTQDPEVDEADLPTFVVNRPCYLADTRSVPSEDCDQHTKFAFEALEPITGLQTINRAEFAGPDAFIETFESGKLVEMTLQGSRGHPIHLHINHFQVFNFTPYTGQTGVEHYIQPGDWHDTLFFEHAVNHAARNGLVRFFTDKFTGTMVLHCHMSSHEDVGMMAVTQIIGDEGAVYERAEELDPTCYRGAGGRGFVCTPEEDCAAINRPVVNTRRGGLR